MLIVAAVACVLLASVVSVAVFRLGYTSEPSNGASNSYAACSSTTMSSPAWYTAITTSGEVFQIHSLFMMNSGKIATICAAYSLNPTANVSLPYNVTFPAFTYARVGPINYIGEWKNSSSMVSSTNPSSFTLEKLGQSIKVEYSLYAPSNSSGYYLLFTEDLCDPVTPISFGYTSYVMVGLGSTPNQNNTQPLSEVSNGFFPGNCPNPILSASIIGVSNGVEFNYTQASAAPLS